MTRFDEIRDNYNSVCERIERAKARRGGSGEVTLLAATKTVPIEEILFAINELGLEYVGENRVQELLSKYDALAGKAHLHLIGTLQTNKVRQIVGKVEMIHSVDSVYLAEEIGRRSEALGITTDILAEINIGDEESKGGVSPSEAEEFLSHIRDIKGISVCGIMTMAPICEKKCEYNKYFSKTYGIFLDIWQKKSDNIVSPVLSMGMSDSFEEAIEEGSTMVRVGSAIFGRRNYR